MDGEVPMNVSKFITKSRPGAALIAIVLVGLIVLSLISAVVISIARNNVRVGTWQTEQIEQTRLDYLARTAAKAVTERLITNPEIFGILNRNDIVSETKKITDGTIKTDLDITIRGDDQRAVVIAKATSEKGKSAMVRATINLTVPSKTVTWSAGN